MNRSLKRAGLALALACVAVAPVFARYGSRSISGSSSSSSSPGDARSMSRGTTGGAIGGGQAIGNAGAVNGTDARATGDGNGDASIFGTAPEETRDAGRSSPRMQTPSHRGHKRGASPR